MDALWLSFGMVFLAEMGDKTQLVALTLASRYNARIVLVGVFVATLLVHLVSVSLGGVAGHLLPATWIKFIAGLSFVVFGMWTLRGDCLEEEDGVCKRRIASPFWIVFTTFFLAELGDKTMLSTVTLAASHSLTYVWIGSTIGMVVADGLAILVGQVLGKRLPERGIQIGAAIIFFVFGIVNVIQGGRSLPAAAWAVGLIAVAGIGLVMLRGLRQAVVAVQED